MLVTQVAKSEGVDFRLLHQAADRLEPKLRRTLLAAFEKLPEATLGPLIAALEAGRIDDVMGLLAASIDPASQAAVSNVLAEAFTGAANLQGAEFNLKFDIQNPRAVQWAEQNTKRLLGGFTDATGGSILTPREASGIRDIVVRGIQDGMAPAVQAREIRQLIGLSRRDATAADTFLRGLLETATTEKQQAAALGRFEVYQRRLLRRRAETIARTETIRAANMGQRAAWDAAADGGLIDKQTTRVIWISTEDSRTCPICAVLDGQTVGFDESFSVREQATSFTQEDGNFFVAGTKPVSGGPHIERTPPAHPRCRCAVGLVETAGGLQGPGSPSPAGTDIFGDLPTRPGGSTLGGMERLPESIRPRRELYDEIRRVTGGVDNIDSIDEIVSQSLASGRFSTGTFAWTEAEKQWWAGLSETSLKRGLSI